MRIIFIIALIFGFCSPPLMAKELLIGFVDVPRLIDKSPQSLDAGKRLEKEFTPRQDALKKQRDKLNNMRKKLEKESLVMSDSQRSELDLGIRKLERDLKRDEQDFREELNIQKNNEFKKVRQLVLQAILKFAKKDKYDLILSEGVVYADKRIDITEQIIEIMAEIETSSS